jgi:hypothetical protein
VARELAGCARGLLVAGRVLLRRRVYLRERRRRPLVAGHLLPSRCRDLLDYVRDLRDARQDLAQLADHLLARDLALAGFGYRLAGEPSVWSRPPWRTAPATAPRADEVLKAAPMRMPTPRTVMGEATLDQESGGSEVASVAGSCR